MAGWLIGIDIGGTFTDVVALDTARRRSHHMKVASHPSDPASSVRAGLQTLTEQGGMQVGDIGVLMHGTTVVTNAIIERTLPRTGLLTTSGFADVLEIGRHWRTELYDPMFVPPPPLLPRDLRFEVRERTGADGTPGTPLEDAEIERALAELHQARVEAVAVVFLHSYANPRHEQQMADALRSANGWFVCASSELSREVREYERTSTTVLNAALMPVVDRYMDKLESALESLPDDAAFFVTQSNGGALTPRAARLRPVSLALSGPAAGVVACVGLAEQLGRGDLIGFDMGGTSADISIVSNFEPRFATQLEVGELPIRLPAVEILSIGAGGGSIATVDDGGALSVGPDSAGSDPGPACYGRGGDAPTITDSQVVLGRLSADFPLGGYLRLRPEAAEVAVMTIASPLGLALDEAAAGIVEVANAAMERAIRVALRKRGDDPRKFALVAFGGAGALHAAELAQRLKIRTVIVPPHPGTLSALGLLAADLRMDFASSSILRTDRPDLTDALAAGFAALERTARQELSRDGHASEFEVRFDRSCDIRYVGQAYEVNVPLPRPEIDDRSTSRLLAHFHELHKRAFGFATLSDPCEIVTMRTAATVIIEKSRGFDTAPAGGAPAQRGERLVYMPAIGPTLTPVYARESLGPGTRVAGPAVIHQTDTTTLVPQFATVEAHASGNLLITIADGDAA